ncbi:THAP domain-containing protein 1-like [Linepithema humile]|uniref:THAP domain-containing protein 1-like n=1 Tax=Linepithema humile TaxID=83485 RepID=UPI00351F15F5
MVFNCCVKGCKTVWSPIRDVSFFSFSLKDQELFKKWQAVIQTNNNISKNSRICSNHFNTSSYRLISGKRLLNKNAVPSIFDYDISENIQFQSYDVETPSCSMEIKEQVSSKSSDLSNVESHPFSVDERIQCQSPPPKICRNNASTQTSPRRVLSSIKEQQLRRKLTICQRQNRRQKQKLTTVMQLLKQLKKEDQNIICGFMVPSS